MFFFLPFFRPPPVYLSIFSHYIPGAVLCRGVHGPFCPCVAQVLFFSVAEVPGSRAAPLLDNGRFFIRHSPHTPPPRCWFHFLGLFGTHFRSQPSALSRCFHAEFMRALYTPGQGMSCFPVNVLNLHVLAEGSPWEPFPCGRC